MTGVLFTETMMDYPESHQRMLRPVGVRLHYIQPHNFNCSLEKEIDIMVWQIHIMYNMSYRR